MVRVQGRQTDRQDGGERGERRTRCVTYAQWTCGWSGAVVMGARGVRARTVPASEVGREEEGGVDGWGEGLCMKVSGRA